MHTKRVHPSGVGGSAAASYSKYTVEVGDVSVTEGDAYPVDGVGASIVCSRS